MSHQETKSSRTSRNWLIGCGIGCGAVILILAVLAAGGFFYIRNIVRGFQDTEAIMETLSENYGRVKDFCPDPDGSIRPARIEAFLSAREGFAPMRERVERTLSTLTDAADADEIEVKTPKNIFRMIRLGFGVIPQIADFFKARNQALLDAEMGMGEYYYIYVMAFYAWLGKEPEDGPDFQLIDGGDWGDYEDREEIHERRRERALRRLNRQLLAMLQNQLEKRREQGAGADQEEWEKKLEAEITAMESDRYRLPWQGGLPEVIEASLQPFRERLKASYSRMTNPLEVALEQR